MIYHLSKGKKYRIDGQLQNTNFAIFHQQQEELSEPFKNASTNHMFGIDTYLPLTTNNFEIRIYGLDGTSPTENSDLLTLSTNEIGEIQQEQDAITVHYGNGLIKFPSKVSFTDVDWTLNCYCSPNVADALQAWSEQVYNPNTELMGLPSQYMRNVYFIKYDGQGNARQVLKSPGTWIRALKYGAMNQEGGQVVQVSCTLVISKIEYLDPASM